MALIDARASDVLESEEIPDAVVQAIAACGKSPRAHDAFATLAASFGFAGFSYILLGCSVTQPRLLRHWTTAGARWTERYAERGYYLVDPRVTLTRHRAVPVTWYAEHGAREARTREFVRDAERFEIRGGVAWSLHDARLGRAVIAWDSRLVTGIASEGAPLRLRLGTLALLAGLIHEALVVHCNSAIPVRTDATLTDRERECVTLAARGMTSADVGVKLGITTRTANFHMGNVITKLGARQPRRGDRAGRRRKPRFARGLTGAAPSTVLAQPLRELGDGMGRPDRREAREMLVRMRAVCDGKRRHAGVARELEIVRGIADHDRLAGIDARGGP